MTVSAKLYVGTFGGAVEFVAQPKERTHDNIQAPVSTFSSPSLYSYGVSSRLCFPKNKGRLEPFFTSELHPCDFLHISEGLQVVRDVESW